MQMTDAHRALLVRWEATFGLPPWNDDNAARDYTRRCAEQFAYTFPGEGWCHKSASPTRPPSTDVIARYLSEHNFWGYDLILDQGRPSQSFNFHPQPLDLSGQTKIDVTPTNHLGISPPDPPVPPPGGGDLEARVTALENQVLALRGKVGLIESWIRSY